MDGGGYTGLREDPVADGIAANKGRLVKTVVVDKIASVAQHSELGTELRVSPDIPCEEGVLVAPQPGIQE